MEIRKLSASFGCLEGESLSFHPGLNVIVAPNESGKSTWCAFIQAMLYGVDTTQRSRSGFIADKQRYAPWSGAPMEGSMELIHGGEEITISRSTRQANAPMREFSAVYTGTGLPVEGLNGTNAGEALTGVGREVFRRSAFMAQGQTAVTSSPELEMRINALVSTGEEQGSYTQADERLRQWQRKRRYNRRGLLPELEGRMEDIRQRQAQLRRSNEELGSLEKRLEDSRLRCQSLEQDMNESRRRQRKDALERMSAGKAQAEAGAQAHREGLERLEESRRALGSGPYGQWDPQDLEDQAAGDLERLKELRGDIGPKPGLWPVILAFVLAGALALGAAFMRLWPLAIPAVLAAGAGIALYIRRGKILSAQARAKDERRRILEKWSASNAQELRRGLEEQRRLREAYAAAQREEQELRQAWDQAIQAQKGLEEQAMAELDFTVGDSPAARLARELERERSHGRDLARELDMGRGRLEALGDPLVLASSLSALEEEQAQAQEEYQAIALALEALKEADTQMQSRFSPELSRLAGEYMSQLTGGRYSGLLLDRDFSASTQLQGDTVSRPQGYLSAGALELMYLSLRLAVCQLALPKGENCPLIIDDALGDLDAQRTARVMELLKKLSQERQIILFTCRDPFKEDKDD